MTRRPWFTQGPDFFVVGFPTGEGVAVCASKEISGVEITHEMEPVWAGDGYLPGPESLSVKCHMGGYVVARAATYQEAFRKLFETWRPTPTERRGLPEGRDDGARHDRHGTDRGGEALPGVPGIGPGTP